MSTDILGTGTLDDAAFAGEGAVQGERTEAQAATRGLTPDPGEARLPQLGISEPTSGPTRSIEALADVLMTVSVELGRTKLPIRDLLNIHSGAVVQLDRQVSQPVDVFVHGTLIARGEVVVVDECFAVRVTELVTGD